MAAIFVQDGYFSQLVVTGANTNRDGTTGTYNEICAPAAKTRIDVIRCMPTEDIAAGYLRLWLRLVSSGLRTLWAERAVSAQEAASVAGLIPIDFDFRNPIASDGSFILPSTYAFDLTSHLAENWHVSVRGGVFA